MPTPDTRTDGGATSSAGATSLAWNHTVSAGLANSALVGHGNTAAATAKTVTTFQWDAAGTPVGLSNLGRVTGPANVVSTELWSLLNPSAGTKQIKITPAASCQIIGGSASYSDVDQGTPWNPASPQSNTGTAGSGTNQPTVTVTSGTNELVVGTAGDNEQSTQDTLALGAGQTAVFNDTISGAGQFAAIGSDQAGGASVTHQYSGFANTNPWTILAGSLRPAPALPYRRPLAPQLR